MTISVPQLRDSFRGEVIAPGDATYDEGRAVFYGAFDRHPAVIIRPADAGEVVGVVNLAAETGMPLAVRSGGHSPAGYGVVDDGIVLDLSALRSMDIDVESGTAWAGTGLDRRRIHDRCRRATASPPVSATPARSGSAG